MANFHFDGESIECDGSEINTRKNVASSILNHPIIGRCIRYLCSRNADSKIIKELNPKVAKIDIRSHLDLNDQIKGERIEVLVQGTKRLKFSVKGGHTSTHKVQTVQSKCYTYSKISKPFNNVIDSLRKRDEALEPIPSTPQISIPKKRRKKKRRKKKKSR